MSFPNRNLKIRSKTWVRDSYGLYDYENTHYHAQTIVATRPGRIVRSNHDISYVNQQINNAKTDKDNTFDSKDDAELLGLIYEKPGNNLHKILIDC